MPRLPRRLARILRVGATAVAALALLGALLVTGLRVTQPSPGWAVRAVSFAPLVLPVYAALALALALTSVTGRSRRGGAPGRRRQRLGRGAASLALVALVALHGYWLWPQFTGGPAAVPTDARPVRLLTLNLLGDAADLGEVVRRVRGKDVDVLVLAEVRPGALARLDAGGLRDLLPRRVGEAEPGVAGTMVLSRFPLRRPERLDTVYGSWATTVVAPGGRFRLLAVHPSAPLEDAAAWSEDHAEILRAARGDVDMVAGDLNATTDHAPLRRLADAGLLPVTDLLGAGWLPTWPANGRVGLGPLTVPRLVQIDHVLLGPRLAALHVERVEVSGSDHSGLLADVTLARPRAR